jgi:hypothetical protein
MICVYDSAPLQNTDSYRKTRRKEITTKISSIKKKTREDLRMN